MSDLRWTYNDLQDIIPIISQESSEPLLATDLNPLISKVLTNLPKSYIYAIGGHSVILHVSDCVVAKISLRSGCQYLRLEQEVFAILDQTPSPYIVRTFLYRPDIIFMEPLTNGTLQEHIVKFGTPMSAFPWMLRIVKAAACLEQHSYAHGDINPRNIIFNNQGQPVLTDFDHALLVGEPLEVGEEPYVRCSEEHGGGQYGSAGAITEQFALGSIFWFMTTGQELYCDIDGHERVNRMLELRFPDTTELGRAGEIISKCWQGKFHTVAQLAQSITEAITFDNTYQTIRSESETYYQNVVD
ncbi:kinase domain-containing protein [Delphinella strobiligena]|nr:kinase domain-containing protein [Delphinella strobiligena]